MERTVPYTASEEVELYLRTYYSLLRSTSDVQIRTLEEVHSAMNSLLHTGVRDQAPDMSAFIYSLLRLPRCIDSVKTIVLGQSTNVFFREGIGEIENWEITTAIARRRRCYFDGNETLACIIASRSDIDDVVPILTAFQIEWNKLYLLLSRLPEGISIDFSTLKSEEKDDLATALEMTIEDLERLYSIWGDHFKSKLEKISRGRKEFKIRLLSGSLREYRRATHAWWKHIEVQCPILLERPLYFVSSNTHSLVNLISGFALLQKETLVQYLESSSDENLKSEWEEIEANIVPSSKENFFYYLLKKYLQTPAGSMFRQKRTEHEVACGVTRIDSEHYFDVDVQVIEIGKINSEWMDPRLCDNDHACFSESDAVILNIDYPLGMGAYQILSKVAEHAMEIYGIYILGKAATLNGVIGDIMIPNVVHDEQSRNTYICPNAFSAGDVSPHLVYGTVLDNQKSVTVRGTFLQNSEYMDVFYREGYTDIEMEAGPYLSAVYEMFRPNRYPTDEIVNLNPLPFDLGILHYASDTPLSKGKNLGANALSYFGMDPTYASSIVVLRRILALEQQRIKSSG